MLGDIPRNFRPLIWLALLTGFLFIIGLSPLKESALVIASRKVFFSGLYPVQYAARLASFNVLESYSRWIFLKNQAAENQRLKEEVRELSSRLLAFDEIQKENDRLSAALQFKQNSRYNLVAAQVISRSGEDFFRFVQLNKGSRASIRENTPVITAFGLLGKVVNVSANTCMVLMIIDPDSSVSAIDTRFHTFGVVEGRGVGKLIMKYVPISEKIEIGDLVATSGLSDFYPSGIPIGRISKVLRRPEDIFYYIEIEPAVKMSGLDEVFAIVGK